jgi:predicted SAM-dependent methyltransferase
MIEFVKNILDKAGIEIKKKKNRNDTWLYNELYGTESVNNRRFYNISAGGHFEFGGKFHHPLWTNIDVDRPWKWNKGREFDPTTDIAHDPLTLKPIPIKSDTAELVQSRFAVEHITDDAAQVMFNEVHRMLKKNGVFRISCPHTDLYYAAYKRKDKHFFYWSKEHDFLRNASLDQLLLDHFAASLTTLRPEGSPKRINDDEFRRIFNTMPYENALNYITSQCSMEFHLTNRRNHINWWNFKKFEKMLSQAGFKQIIRSSPFQSAAPVMRNDNYFDNLYNGLLIYVEAIKD